jgi:hypothetical protein
MKKKWKMGYKVVRIFGTNYASCVMACRGHKVYKIGGVTKRTEGYGPLAVFTNKKHAIRFRLEDLKYGNYEMRKILIMRCRFVESEDNEYWTLTCGSTGVLHRVYQSPTPEGKHFADEVELIEDTRLVGKL